MDARQVDKATSCLTHDAANNTCVGLTADAELVTFDNRGSVRGVRPLIDGLPVLHETTRRLRHVRGITLAAHGRVVAILEIRRSGVTHLWTHDAGTDLAQLTYKANA